MSETEKKTLSDYVGAAILKYRVVILSFLAVLIGAALIAGIVLSLLSAQKKIGTCCGRRFAIPLGKSAKRRANG